MVERININALWVLLEWHIHQRDLTVVFFLFFYTLQSLPLPAQTLSNALYVPTVVSVFSTLNNPAEMDNHVPKITTMLNLAILNYLFQDSLEKDNNSNLFPESSGYESLTSHKRAIQQTFREAFQKTEPLSRENNHGVENARAETKIRYNNFLSASKKEKISENPYEENSEDFYEESRYLAWNAKKFQDCQEQAFELTVPFENDESSLSLINLSIEENGETNLAIVSEFQFMPDLTLVYNCDNNQWMIMYPHQSGDELTSVNCEHDGCGFMGMVEVVAIHSEKCGYRKIQCVNFNNGLGCLDSVVCKDMDDHLKSCSYARADCENKERGCNVVMLRHEQIDHKKGFPESIKNCPYCETTLTQRTLEDHKKNCESRLEPYSICSIKKQKLEDDQCSICPTCRATTERSEEEQPQESEQREVGESLQDALEEPHQEVQKLQEQDRRVESLRRRLAEIELGRKGTQHNKNRWQIEIAEIRRQAVELQRQAVEVRRKIEARSDYSTDF